MRPRKFPTGTLLFCQLAVTFSSSHLALSQFFAYYPLYVSSRYNNWLQKKYCEVFEMHFLIHYIFIIERLALRASWAKNLILKLVKRKHTITALNGKCIQDTKKHIYTQLIELTEIILISDILASKPQKHM